MEERLCPSCGRSCTPVEVDCPVCGSSLSLELSDPPDFASRSTPRISWIGISVTVLIVLTTLVGVSIAGYRIWEKYNLKIDGTSLKTYSESVIAIGKSLSREKKQRFDISLQTIVMEGMQPGSEEKVATTLYTSCEALRIIALLLAPFLPDSAPEILKRLGIPDALEKARLPDDAARWGILEPGTQTLTGYALYFVCSGESGECVYLRQDFSLEVPVKAAAPARRRRR